MIYYLPIQPLGERYTKQWFTWFPEEFERQGIPFGLVYPDSIISDVINTGTFLDTNSSIKWYSDQVGIIANIFHAQQIKDGDVVFLADCEMFGLEGAIKYLATLNNVKVKICGFAHAGSYTKEDFVEKCSPFAKWYENAWGGIFDLIFVGSEYHKRQLVTKRLISPHKIVVTGNPYDIDGTLALIPKIEKKNRIICTNRPDYEKRPLQTLLVFKQLQKLYPDWEFMVTTSRKYWGCGSINNHALDFKEVGWLQIKEGLSKIEYLTLLAESKVMTGNSIEENFGYCILESLIVDTIPIVEKAFSHPELLENDERCLFMNPVHQKMLITDAMKSPFPVKQHSDQYRSSLQRIVTHLISD